MSDERLNLNGEPENPGTDKETQAGPEVLEQFLEEQADADNAACEEAAEQPEEFSNPAPSAETPTYAWAAPKINVSESAPAEENSAESKTPPAWDGEGANNASRINMQVKKKKKRKWLIAIVVCVVAVWLLITGAIILGAIQFFRNVDVNFNFSTGQFEVGNRHNGGIFFDRQEPDVKEHLQISPTPQDKDSQLPAAGSKLTVKQIAKKVRTSVVGVVAEGTANFSSSSVGSGIIMSADGYIITNNHVIENTNKISVVTDDGTSYDAYVIGTDSRTDLAVLKVDAQNLPAAEFGDSDLLEQGDVAVAIGNPAGIQLQNTVTAGIISAINRNIVVEDEEMTLIQTDASINPGNSGGPLVNEYGQVIGINTVKIGISYYEGLGFAIPINTAKPIIDELISRGYITGRPSIGISGITISERDAAFYGLKAGMYVEFVHPYSDAYKKGLQSGDVIIAMNGTSLASHEELKKLRDEHKAGDTVKLTVYRQGREFTINVMLMDEVELNKMGQPSGSAG